MKTIELKDVPAPFSAMAENVAAEPLIITRKGKPYAALFSIKDADWETISLSTNPKFIQILERSRKRHRQEGGISLDEVRRRLGIKSSTKGPAKKVR